VLVRTDASDLEALKKRPRPSFSLYDFVKVRYPRIYAAV